MITSGNPGANQYQTKTFQTRYIKAYQANAEEDGEFDVDEAYDQSAGTYHAEDQVPEEEILANPGDIPQDSFFVRAESISCLDCGREFSSNNRLHDHLRTECTISNHTDQTSDNEDRILIKSKATPIKGDGYAFRSWRYAKLRIHLQLDGPLHEICVDSGCTMSLIDKVFLRRFLPELKVRTMTSSISVRGIGSNIHRSTEYILLNFYVDGKLSSGKPATALFTRELHLVDDLRANILMGTDILTPEEMILDFGTQTLKIGSCGLTAGISTIRRDDPGVKNKVYSREKIIIEPGSTIDISIKSKTLPKDRDFLFEPNLKNVDLGPHGGVYAHLVDSSLSFVRIKNNAPKKVIIPRHANLGTVIEYDQDGCFLANPEDEDRAIPPNRPKGKFLGKLLTSALALTAMIETTQPSYRYENPTTLTPFESKPAEIVIDNGITIYGSSLAVDQIKNAAMSYDIWTDRGTTVDVPEDNWMPITLKDNVIIKPAKVYPLGPQDKKIVDDTLNKLHDKGKVEWTKESTPHGYPVFVIWRNNSSGGKKGRMVVDIRGLNQITVPDSYPMPLQSDIIQAVSGCSYISVIDAQGYFYQYWVRASDRHKFTIVSHRGQETFNVAIMGFKNSPSYVQRQTDGILRKYRGFARSFMDDIVVFSKTLPDHLEHLRTIFQVCVKKRICINPKKCFLGYPSVNLLGQKVDALGMTTAEDKIKAISSLEFPKTLQALETYIGMINWLRTYVRWFAQMVEPLQKRKTQLAKGLTNNAQRKKMTNMIKFDPTEIEKESFRLLQRQFSKPSFLAHYDMEKTLYIDLDASKTFGFGAMIYHLEGDLEGDPVDIPLSPKVLPILFLSKCLNKAERNYWPTELEMAGLVWTIRRVRHLVESSKKTPIVYTDHSALVDLAKQTSLSTSSTDKLNLRLIRASQYLSGFTLDIRHRPGSTNVVPDALSRLIDPTADVSHTGMGILEGLHVWDYNVSLVEMSSDLKSRLCQAYEKDPKWKKLLNYHSRSQ